ncbi:MAG: TIGR00282 family metallophosphoesterase [Spirochaetaceae bacterium]|jgi:metallophosphoesterase (TIGR00282 family)|nr:TIGR00282 family metallophosphoesterase [Spirochaetaceae bacterium]
MHDEQERLKLIMIGDVVGEPGLSVLEAELPALIQKMSADFVVVNGENAAEGFGLTMTAFERIRAAGADVVTSGNHIWEKREFWSVLDTEQTILRPANYPPGTPGHGFIILEKNGMRWFIINLQGRELMTPIDCPFKSFDSIFSAFADREHEPSTPDGQIAPDCIVAVDFHAETSREKEALGFYLDGRASVVVGTHTHVQTTDEKILPKGTAYLSDLGMTGVTDSIIGMNTDICIQRERTQIAYRMECATGPATINGLTVEINRKTKKIMSLQCLYNIV